MVDIKKLAFPQREFFISGGVKSKKFIKLKIARHFMNFQLYNFLLQWQRIIHLCLFFVAHFPICGVNREFMDAVRVFVFKRLMR